MGNLNLHSSVYILGRSLILLSGMQATCFAQVSSVPEPTTSPGVIVRTTPPALSSPLPPYILCRHFLTWLLSLDKDAQKKNASDPLAFSAPFSTTLLLTRDNFILLKTKASSLDKDMSALDLEAQGLISSYRSLARVQTKSGGTIPPPPAKLRLLQQQKTAVLITHYLALKDKLGATDATKLDYFLVHDFAAHLKVESLQEVKRVEHVTSFKQH